jgi:7-carboxy-7-deazaguanine synthase
LTTGNIDEVFSSYQGEGGSVRGSCMGKRQIFVRFAGCNLAGGSMGTKGCIFCDSPEAALGRAPWARIQSHPGKGDFTRIRNPVSTRPILQAIEGLVTRDLHSVSFTGGEPLCQPEPLGELAGNLRAEGLMTYLETNGSLPEAAKSVAGVMNRACVDVKDRSARASLNWEELLLLEIGTIRALVEGGSKTFAKLVVTDQTRPRDVERVSEMLEPLPCDLALQIVTPRGGMKRPTRRRLFDITEAAAKHLQPDRLSISAQLHTIVGLR